MLRPPGPTDILGHGTRGLLVCEGIRPKLPDQAARHDERWRLQTKVKGCGNPSIRLKEKNHGIMSKQRGAHSGTDSHNQKNTGRSHRYETRVLVHTRNEKAADRRACMWQSDGHAQFYRTSALTFDQQEPYRSSVMPRLFLLVDQSYHFPIVTHSAVKGQLGISLG